MTRNELKDIIKECLNEKVNNSNNSELIDEAVIFEMKAKQLDLDDMKDAAQGIKYVAGYYIEIIKTFDKILVEITSRLNACKTKEDIVAVYNDIRTKYPEQSREKYKEFDSTQGSSQSFTKLRRVCKKFNIKYSDEAMEEKKKIDIELTKLKESILDIAGYWCTVDGKGNNLKKVNALNKAFDHIKDINEEYYKLSLNEVAEIFTLMIQEIQYTLNDIAFTRSYLKLKKEKSLTYKIVNKLIKTNK